MSWTPGFAVPHPDASSSDLYAPISETDTRLDDLEAVVHTGGLFASRPSATGLGDGSTYFASDVNGGTLYRVHSAAWEQVAPGVTEASGVELARTELTSSPSTVSSASLADVSGLSVTFATGSRPAILHAVFPQCSNGTAGSGGRIAITSSTGTVLSDAAGDSGSASGLFQLRAELKIAANTPSATYKVQAAHRTSGTFTMGALANRTIKLYAVTC